MDYEHHLSQLEKNKEQYRKLRKDLDHSSRLLESGQKQQLKVTLGCLLYWGVFALVWGYISEGVKHEFLLNLSSEFIGGAFVFLIIYGLWENLVSRSFEVRDLNTRLTLLIYQLEALDGRLVEIMNEYSENPSASTERIEVILMQTQFRIHQAEIDSMREHLERIQPALTQESWKIWRFWKRARKTTNET